MIGLIFISSSEAHHRGTSVNRVNQEGSNLFSADIIIAVVSETVV